MTTHLSDISLGYHLLIDMYGCTSNLYMDLDQLSASKPDHLISTEIGRVGLTSKQYVTEVFDNHSWSSCFLLAESHVSVHTWPESNHVSADIYVCNFSADNREKADQLKEYLLALFSASSSNIQTLERSTG